MQPSVFPLAVNTLHTCHPEQTRAVPLCGPLCGKRRGKSKDPWMWTNPCSVGEFSPVRLLQHARTTTQTVRSRHSGENALQQHRDCKQCRGPSAPRLGVREGNDSTRRYAQDDRSKLSLTPTLPFLRHILKKLQPLRMTGINGMVGSTRTTSHRMLDCTVETGHGGCGRIAAIFRI